ncbi:very-long-chain (3R)-3-hydroxyacyl-CoA dehydratase 2-like [Daphnia pulex]|uniref:very-long-chain (3R)-3-hydroxyacyl-CoA dehydratase 2-like n=1 Tax=Daphnia pulex TaxID=6669 RepID=UPI001EDDDEF2|nr:very-long-chain (3R)-3-hydroxyacyl-CoA dehydratase 2-like [Daphnia pulex]
MDNPKIGNRIPEFPDMDSIAKDLFADPTQPNPTHTNRWHCTQCQSIIPSNVGITFAQVFSRVFLLWPILYYVTTTRDQFGFPLLLIAWTVTEVLRYLYYILNLLSTVPAITLVQVNITRYSFFIILYPIGITGELISCYCALLYYTGIFGFTTKEVK